MKNKINWNKVLDILEEANKKEQSLRKSFTAAIEPINESWTTLHFGFYELCQNAIIEIASHTFDGVLPSNPNNPDSECLEWDLGYYFFDYCRDCMEKGEPCIIESNNKKYDFAKRSDFVNYLNDTYPLKNNEK